MADTYRYVNRDVYNNTRNQAQQARRDMTEARANLERARDDYRQAEAEIKARSRLDFNELRALMRNQENLLTEDLRDLDEELRLELGRQNVRLRKELDELRTNIDSSNRNIDAINRRINQITVEFNANIRSITDRITKQKDRSRYYLNQLDSVMREIDQLHPEKLTPGRAEQLHDSRDSIATDIGNGDYEAAIALAQSSLIDAVALQSELETLNDEFNYLAGEIAEDIIAIQDQIQHLSNNNDNIQRVTFGQDQFERAYTYNGDINYWSSGLFEVICSHFYNEENQVNEFIENMDLENMRIAHHNLPNYKPRFDQCDSFAKDEFNISIRIQNLALRINDSLTNDGFWVLNESGFDNNDYRRSYSLIFKDGFQNTVSIGIIPDGSEDGAITSSIQAFDGETINSMGDCVVLRNAVIARLRSCGIRSIADDEGKIPEGYKPREFITSTYMDGAKIKEGRRSQAESSLNFIQGA